MVCCWTPRAAFVTRLRGLPLLTVIDLEIGRLDLRGGDDNNA
jgi:hypothetical protein